jgi:hypothetical protein
VRTSSESCIPGITTAGAETEDRVIAIKCTNQIDSIECPNRHYLKDGRRVQQQGVQVEGRWQRGMSMLGGVLLCLSRCAPGLSCTCCTR